MRKWKFLPVWKWFDSRDTRDRYQESVVRLCHGKYICNIQSSQAVKLASRENYCSFSTAACGIYLYFKDQFHPFFENRKQQQWPRNATTLDLSYLVLGIVPFVAAVIAAVVRGFAIPVAAIHSEWVGEWCMWERKEWSGGRKEEKRKKNAIWECRAPSSPRAAPAMAQTKLMPAGWLARESVALSFASLLD